MNEKASPKNGQKKSVVRRILTTNDIFYKNIDTQHSNLDRGLTRGRKLLTAFLQRGKVSKFNKFIITEYDEINGLVELRYGEQAGGHFLDISLYVRSALENGGFGNPDILRKMIKDIEKKGGQNDELEVN